MRISPTRAPMVITAATCAGSVRSTGASTDGGGDVRAWSMVATGPEERNASRKFFNTVVTPTH